MVLATKSLDSFWSLEQVFRCEVIVLLCRKAWEQEQECEVVEVDREQGNRR